MQKAKIATRYLVSSRQLATKATTYRFKIRSVIDDLREALRALAESVKVQGQTIDKIISRMDDKNPKVRDLAEALDKNSESNEKLSKTLEAKLPAVLPELNAKQTGIVSKAMLESLNRKKRTVFFSAEGDLFLDPEKKHCYPMSTGKLRVRIIRILLERKGFTATDTLAGLVETSRKSLEYAIDRINALGKQKLNKNITLIDGRRFTGYRIHPDIVIRQL